jgi:hypothetical protein
MQFCSITVVPKYFNFAMFLKDLLAVFMLHIRTVGMSTCKILKLLMYELCFIVP